MLGYHYIVGQSWNFVFQIALGAIALVPVIFAIRYMRRWFGSDYSSGATFFRQRRDKDDGLL
jgi:hypothetical protein